MRSVFLLALLASPAAAGVMNYGVNSNSVDSAVNGQNITPASVTASSVSISGDGESACLSIGSTFTVNCQLGRVSISTNSSALTGSSFNILGYNTATGVQTLGLFELDQTDNLTSSNTVGVSFRGLDTLGVMKTVVGLDMVMPDHTAAHTSGSLAFSTRNNNAFSEKMRLANTGFLGIGTTAPTTALTIGSGVITSSTTMGTIACNAGTGVLSVTATDQHGTFTAGASAANCTVTFGTAWPKTPDCICADDTSILAIKATATTTTLQCTAAVTMSGDTLTYICMGAP